MKWRLRGITDTKSLQTQRIIRCVYFCHRLVVLYLSSISHLWRWCCHWSATEAGLLRTCRCLKRSPWCRCSPELAACSAPSSGLGSAGRPPGRRGAHLAGAGGQQWQRGSRLTPPAPQPDRWDDKAAAGTGGEPAAVWNRDVGKVKKWSSARRLDCGWLEEREMSLLSWGWIES